MHQVLEDIMLCIKLENGVTLSDLFSVIESSIIPDEREISSSRFPFNWQTVVRSHFECAKKLKHNDSEGAFDSQIECVE